MEHRANKYIKLHNKALLLSSSSGCANNSHNTQRFPYIVCRWLHIYMRTREYKIREAPSTSSRLIPIHVAISSLSMPMRVLHKQRLAKRTCDHRKMFTHHPSPKKCIRLYIPFHSATRTFTTL